MDRARKAAEESLTRLKCQEDLAKVVARAKGENSEAARALQELERQRAAADAGELIMIFPLAGGWVVGNEEQVRSAVNTRRQAQRARTAKMLQRVGRERHDEESP